MNRYIFIVVISFMSLRAQGQEHIRNEILLRDQWTTLAHADSNAYAGFEKIDFDDKKWIRVRVPHNWDGYDGYRRLKHGNRHGSAWYRKTFNLKALPGKQYFLFFEGVGSYATVWLNGKRVGYHAGGRTTFTLDITKQINRKDEMNILSVRADHPASIRDLPWVCGGCSDEVGFSEGSQPMGIFRPVHVIVTDPVRIEPFGVHIWNDTTVSEKSAILHLATEVKNYSSELHRITLINKLVDKQGHSVMEISQEKEIKPQETITIKQNTPELNNPHFWSLDDPYCYTVISTIVERGKDIDQDSIRYGIRWIRWPGRNASASNQFLLNGKPVFINGTAEYEHMMGQSHAFTDEQIHARVMQIKSAGFNAFRDAHQPHNLRYQYYWDQFGLLWWPQMAAHIWFDTPEFRNNFKKLLVDWVKERRNSPSLILWGLENESHLPEDFARECTELIRTLDPTTSSQRKVTTCNGGKGTDWDVPQNWTGTYGGDPLTYAQDIQRQILIGEYGAWRSLDLHTEGPFKSDGVLSEDRMTQLMETKIRLAESVKNNSSGQFHWLFTSHENPGRVQGGEGFRELDRVGPVNYKGLFTAWGEPTDAFYMFRANYTSKQKDPMVYIVSHTWPDRWLTTGKKDSIIVYSNCDEVELFNDVRTESLGRKSNGGIGTHFQWDNIDVRYNVLYAVGYVNGREVTRDYIVLHHLPASPNFGRLSTNAKDIIAPQASLNYLYRVNCGGPLYVDKNGSMWSADVHRSNEKSWGSVSWTDDFEEMPSFYGSQRRTYDPIKGTSDWYLFQNFRYGRDKLRYEFPVPDGDYVIELYFIEPWYGTGGAADCAGWRVFDVNVNDKTEINGLDIWKEAGHDSVVKKVIHTHVSGGLLTISFPATAGQAVISAIAIATTHAKTKAAFASPSLIEHLAVNEAVKNQWSLQSWLDTGDKQYADEDSYFSKLPAGLYGAEWIRTPVNVQRKDKLANFKLTQEADVYIVLDDGLVSVPKWVLEYEDTKTFAESDFGGGHRYHLYRKRFTAGANVILRENGNLPSGVARMYTVFVKPVDRMVPAIDLRPVISYKAIDAQVTGPGAEKDSVNNRACITLAKAGAIIEWNISFGVAGQYALRFRYANRTDKISTGAMQLIAADGKTIKTERIEFGLSQVGKWKLAETTTGTMINAGNYKIRLEFQDIEKLSIRDLEVQ